MSGPLHASTGGQPGDGGAVVVLVHGAGNNRTVWSTQARHLAARGCQVLALDLPGHGMSPGPPCESVPSYARAVVADLDRRGVERFGIAGHSMGAMVALAIAAEHHDRVTGLALIGAGLQLAVNTALLDATRDDPLLAARAIVDWAHSPTSHLGASEAPGTWMDGADLALLRAEIAAHPGSLHADFAATADYDGSDAAAAVTAPTIVIAGERDLMTPPKLGHAVAAAMSDAHCVVLVGAGHMLMTERPREVSALLADQFCTAEATT